MTWESARERFDCVVLSVLQEHGKEIGAKALNDKACADVIHYYKMLHRSFDPMTLVLLEKSMSQAGYPPQP